MEYKVKKKSDTQAVVTFTATAADIEGAYEKAYVKAASKVKLPGFRPGKAPIDLVKKHLGDSVIEDAANILVIDAYNDTVEKLDPSPVSRPSFKLEKFEPGKGAEFEAEYEFLPEIKLAKYKKLKVEQEQPEFEEALYEPVLTKIQEQNVIMVPREGQPVSEGDVVTLNLQIVQGKKELYKNSELEFDTAKDEIFPGLKEAVSGKKVGDAHSYEVDVEKNFPDRRYAGKKVTVSFDTVDVRARELPAINDELAAQAGEFSTLADLKADIKSKILKVAEEHLKGRAMDSLIKQIIEKNPFAVPTALVETEVERILANLSRRLGIEEGKRISIEGLAQLTGRTGEEVKSEYEAMALENIKSRMVIDETARLESIEVTDADLEKEIRERLVSAGYEDGPMLDRMVQDENLRSGLRDEMKVKKTLDWLYENAEVKKGDKVSIKKLIEEGKIRI